MITQAFTAYFQQSNLLLGLLLWFKCNIVSLITCMTPILVLFWRLIIIMCTVCVFDINLVMVINSTSTILVSFPALHPSDQFMYSTIVSIQKKQRVRYWIMWVMSAREMWKILSSSVLYNYYGTWSNSSWHSNYLLKYIKLASANSGQFASGLQIGGLYPTFQLLKWVHGVGWIGLSSLDPALDFFSSGHSPVVHSLYFVN